MTEQALIDNISYNIYSQKINNYKSYENMAIDLNMCDKRLARIVRKSTSPKINELAKISEKFNVPLIDFLTKKIG